MKKTLGLALAFVIVFSFSAFACAICEEDINGLIARNTPAGNSLWQKFGICVIDKDNILQNNPKYVSIISEALQRISVPILAKMNRDEVARGRKGGICILIKNPTEEILKSTKSAETVGNNYYHIVAIYPPQGSYQGGMSTAIIIHEFMHIIHHALQDAYEGFDREIIKLNTGKKYIPLEDKDDCQECAYEGENKAYFANAYAMHDVYEDVASLIEVIYKEPEKLKQYPILQQKADIIKIYIQTYYGTTGLLFN